MQMKILITEDDSGIRSIFVKLLTANGYDVVEAKDGAEALEILGKNDDIDVVLMDMNMPKVDGITATRKIRERAYPVVVIMVTAFADKKAMKEAAEAGADDFVSKPVNLNELLARIKIAERSLCFYRARHLFFTNLSLDYSATVDLLERLRQENENLTLETINTLYKVSEYRDYETYGHTMRVGWLASKLAMAIGLGERFALTMRLAAPLHDLGKIKIPDRILLKPGKLTKEEFEIIKTHTVAGYDIMKDNSAVVLNYAAEIALTHHERWDGSGYPKGFKKEEIPMSGALTAVADSFDVIVSKRPYKEARSLDEAFSDIKSRSKKWYNPDIVDALFSIEDEVRDFYQNPKNMV